MAMPRFSAAAGERKWQGSPSSMISPEVSDTAPAIALHRVDLPAPFSPTSACTSPG
jgi:hypothetical protein